MGLFRRRPRRPLGWLTAGLIGLAFFGIGGYFLYLYVVFSAYGQDATATVVSFDGTRRTGRRSKRTVYDHTLKYPEGLIQKEFSQQYMPGTELEIVYVPGAQMVELKQSAPDLFLPGFMAIIGLGFVAVGYWQHRKGVAAF